MADWIVWTQTELETLSPDTPLETVSGELVRAKYLQNMHTVNRFPAKVLGYMEIDERYEAWARTRCPLGTKCRGYVCEKAAYHSPGYGPAPGVSWASARQSGSTEFPSTTV